MAAVHFMGAGQSGVNLRRVEIACSRVSFQIELDKDPRRVASDPNLLYRLLATIPCFMSQRIAAYRVKDRPVLVLVGGSAGRTIGGVSVFVVDRNGHSPRCLIAHLDHAVRVEKREGRCFCITDFSSCVILILYSAILFLLPYSI